MVAHMNADALARTIETGEAWYWSRSRGALWRKGDTSGQVQTVVELRVDCDQDALVAQGARRRGRRLLPHRPALLLLPGRPLGQSGAGDRALRFAGAG